VGGRNRVDGDLDDITAMHAEIRSRIPLERASSTAARVNPKNAAALLSLAEVDGVLVGGASLNAEDFWGIARSCG
jgi:triosephosphate isomerase